MKEEFMIEQRGKQYVLFAGLLDEAHSKGIASLETNLIQIPSAENGDVAIVQAVVEMIDERKFSGIGDASPQNVNRNIAPHLIRMAETRAKARALRDAINVGATAFEELSDVDGDGENVRQIERSENSAASGTSRKVSVDDAPNTKKGGANQITSQQKGQLTNISKELFPDDDADDAKKKLNAWVKNKFKKQIAELSRPDADKIIAGLRHGLEERAQQSEEKEEPEDVEDDLDDITADDLEEIDSVGGEK